MVLFEKRKRRKKVGIEGIEPTTSCSFIAFQYVTRSFHYVFVEYSCFIGVMRGFLLFFVFCFLFVIVSSFLFSFVCLMCSSDVCINGCMQQTIQLDRLDRLDEVSIGTVMFDDVGGDTFFPIFTFPPPFPPPFPLLFSFLLILFHSFHFSSHFISSFSLIVIRCVHITHCCVVCDQLDP